MAIISNYGATPVPRLDIILTMKELAQTQRILNNFERLINEIDNKFFYAVFGGFAVDAYVGKITRKHPDVDLFCFRKDVQKVNNTFRNLGYKYENCSHPQEKEYIYKINTMDKHFTFHIIDEFSSDKIEVGFYHFPHLVFPKNFVYPPTYKNLGGLMFPVVSKKFLIELKKNEVDFYEKEKLQKPLKYNKRHKMKNKNSISDLKLLSKNK